MSPIKFLLGTCALAVVSLSLAGTDRGNGGEFTALIFVAGAHQVFADLKVAQEAGDFQEIPLSKLKDAIADTRVDVVSDDLTDVFGNSVDARTIPDLRRPGFFVIQLQESRIDKVIATQSSWGALILHEYLHVIGVPDLRYEVSSRYKERLTGAECYEKLTRGYKGDSELFKLDTAELEPYPENLTLDVAKGAIVKLAEKHECRADEITFDGKDQLLSAKGCRAVVPGAPYSVTCYVPTNLGFFLVSFDGVDGVNLLFNRWD